MATDVILPALGMAQDTGKIVEWLKAEGESVTAGEPLVVIETDKAAVDLEAPATGILSRVAAKVGDEAPVGHVIAVILSPEEALSPIPSPFRGGGPEAEPEPEAVTSAVVVGLSGIQSANGRRQASPKARRIAAARGVDLVAVRGSGPGGAVLAADVLAAGSAASPVPAAADGQPMSTAISTVWRLMAERTTQSWVTTPHFFLVRELDATAFKQWFAQAGKRTTEKLTYTDLLVKVVATALRLHPRLNASWQNGAIVTHDEVNIALAVATPDGLVAPVIARADDLSLSGIARQRTEMVARAQAGKLRPDDFQGGTFTISNLGMYGVDAFTAIINSPQAAILAVGALVDRVIPVDGQPAVRPTITLTLSCDHRVVDGARGAQFLATVAELMTDPAGL
ncbi:MAG TPA: dihydrolipoamide acetyltransferase family protein [Ktedonobacterales bacterium]|jgi:pyruvate dehydrogenase E2 component (dihydrolipoamide acetyltransferase)|nr:dihydrolipoamide acetyltransferase family protein [Ktedonobacterales bacterium]